MTNEEMNTQLYNRMKAEQDQFRAYLLTQSTEIVLRRAYEYTVRESILFVMEGNNLSEHQCRALLSLQNPLEAVYSQWEREDPRLFDPAMDAIKERADAKIREDFIKSRRDAR